MLQDLKYSDHVQFFFFFFLNSETAKVLKPINQIRYKTSSMSQTSKNRLFI